MMRSRRKARTISANTRRAIFDLISLERIQWSGRLSEETFLGRLYTLSEMASTDRRFADAAGDIRQHRERNHDWDDDWVLNDERFALITAPDTEFVAFLTEGIHPVVRPDLQEATDLCDQYNEILKFDGWEIRKVGETSGRPIFEGGPVSGLKKASTALDLPRYTRLEQEESIREHLRRIDHGLSDDPAAAIASSKELVETTCKLILDDYPEVPYSDRDDLPQLFRKTTGVLRLRAEDIPQSRRGTDAAQKILRALTTQVQGLGELRSTIGLGHGRARTSPAKVRHARLAFNASTTVVEFLLDTWHERRPHHPAP